MLSAISAVKFDVNVTANFNLTEVSSLNLQQFLRQSLQRLQFSDHTRTMADRGNFTSKLDPAASSPSFGMLEIFLALNIFLSITASLGNAVILVALHKVTSIYPPTKLFFRCLAVTDLCVGLVAQPLFATFILLLATEVKEKAFPFVHESYNVVTWILTGVALLTSAAISVDRLLALLLGLSYRLVVTLKRVRVAIICFWLVSASAGTLWIWRKDIFLKAVSGLFLFCLLIVIFCYTRIHFNLRRLQQTRQQTRVSPLGQANGGGIPLNIARYKKSVSSILWVQLALAACFVPWSILVLMFFNGINNSLAWIATETLIYLNSSLNPILYCWKIREVRRAAKATVKRLNCC